MQTSNPEFAPGSDLLNMWYPANQGQLSANVRERKYMLKSKNNPWKYFLSGGVRFGGIHDSFPIISDEEKKISSSRKLSWKSWIVWKAKVENWSKCEVEVIPIIAPPSVSGNSIEKPNIHQLPPYRQTVILQLGKMSFSIAFCYSIGSKILPSCVGTYHNAFGAYLCTDHFKL